MKRSQSFDRTGKERFEQISNQRNVTFTDKQKKEASPSEETMPTDCSGMGRGRGRRPYYKLNGNEKHDQKRWKRQQT